VGEWLTFWPCGVGCARLGDRRRAGPAAPDKTPLRVTTCTPTDQSQLLPNARSSSCWVHPSAIQFSARLARDLNPADRQPNVPTPSLRHSPLAVRRSRPLSPCAEPAAPLPPPHPHLPVKPALELPTNSARTSSGPTQTAPRPAPTPARIVSSITPHAALGPAARLAPDASAAGRVAVAAANSLESDGLRELQVLSHLW